MNGLILGMLSAPPGRSITQFRSEVHGKIRYLNYETKDLGHSNIAITLGTYSHVLPSMQREAAKKIDDLLRPKP